MIGTGMSLFHIVGWVFIFFFSLLATAAQNLVVNGGFEEPQVGDNTYKVLSEIPGWITTFGPGIEIQNRIGGASHRGTQHVELDSFSNSGMAQRVWTDLNASYQLVFHYSPRPGFPADSNGIEVLFNNRVVTNVTAGRVGISTTLWRGFTNVIVGTGSDSFLEFKAVGVSDATGGFIDSVSLTKLAPKAPLLAIEAAPTGQFGFTVRSDEAFYVETSLDMNVWVRWTNSFPRESRFFDTNAATTTRRFFRAVITD